MLGAASRAPCGPESVRRGPALPVTGVWDRPAAAVAGALRTATVSVAAWLTGLPRRAGNRLFANNDAEAGWRGWQVTVLNGGLARQYRDPRFDTMRDQLDPHGGRVEPDPQGGGGVQAVPEAWDDHWNGCPLGPGDDNPWNPRPEDSGPATPPRDGVR